MPRSRKVLQWFPSAWTQEHPAGKQISSVPVSVFMAVSWTYALCPMSPIVLEPALAVRWKQRFSFANAKSLSEGFPGARCIAFPWPEGQPHPARQQGEHCSPFENAPLLRAASLPRAHVPVGSSLQGLGCKTGRQGQAQKVCKVPWLFLWMTALTRRYSDSLCSQGLRKPASSGFLTRFFFSLILNCTFPNRWTARLL